MKSVQTLFFNIIVIFMREVFRRVLSRLKIIKSEINII